MQKLSVCANEDGFDAHSVARIAFDAHTVFFACFFFLACTHEIGLSMLWKPKYSIYFIF